VIQPFPSTQIITSNVQYMLNLHMYITVICVTMTDM